MKKYEIIKPDYYDEFQCKGSSCRYTCCQEWGITVSKEEVRRTKQLLRDGIVQSDYDIFKKLPPKERSKRNDSLLVFDEDQKCPFLNEEQLCEIHGKCGPQALWSVCRIYPRKAYAYGDIHFYTLSLGCEKVLELLLHKKGRMTLESYSELAAPAEFVFQVLNHSQKEQMLTGAYFHIINFYTALMQADDISLEDRMILLGIGMKQIDKLTEEGKFLETPQYCEQYLRTLETMEEDVNTLLPEVGVNSADLLSNSFLTAKETPFGGKKYKEFSEAIRKNFKVTVEVKNGVEQFSYSPETYANLQEEYETFMKDKPYFMENLLLSFMYYLRFPFDKGTGETIWENYMYITWFGSIVKFYITASMPQIQTDEDMIDILAVLFREWGQNKVKAKEIIKWMHDEGCDDLAHLALLIKSS